MNLTPAIAGLARMVALLVLWEHSASVIANHTHLVWPVSKESLSAIKQEGLMEVGAVGPLGAPVFKGRDQGAENVIIPLPERVERPVLEKRPKAGSVKTRTWRTYDYLSHIAFSCLWFQKDSAHLPLPYKMDSFKVKVPCFLLGKA